MRRSQLGAAHDDPPALIKQAIAEASGYHGGDSFKIRRAAETGWLAASSTADVVAKQLGMRQPRGYDGRAAVLRELESRAGMRRGALVIPFQAARGTLHGSCFHEDVCKPPVIHDVLAGVQTMTADAAKAVSKLRGRRG